MGNSLVERIGFLRRTWSCERRDTGQLDFAGGSNRCAAAHSGESAGVQLALNSADYLTGFRLEDGLAVWTYHVREVVVEKLVLLPHLQNTVHVSYQVISKGVPPRLELRPAFHFRHHEAPVDADLAAPYKLTAIDGRYEIAAARRKLPPLRMQLHGRESAFTIAPSKIPQVVYRIEQHRGYSYEGELWSPGFCRLERIPGSRARLHRHNLAAARCDKQLDEFSLSRSLHRKFLKLFIASSSSEVMPMKASSGARDSFESTLPSEARQR